MTSPRSDYRKSTSHPLPLDPSAAIDRALTEWEFAVVTGDDTGARHWRRVLRGLQNRIPDNITDPSLLDLGGGR